MIGHSASNGGQDRGHFRVTYHHNYWDNVNSRYVLLILLPVPPSLALLHPDWLLIQRIKVFGQCRLKLTTEYSSCPSLRFGTGHIYSSCYENIPTSGINSREGAQVLVEHSHFSNVNRAIVTDLDANDEGFAVERDNIFENSDTEITQMGSYSPPYSYT